MEKQFKKLNEDEIVEINNKLYRVSGSKWDNGKFTGKKLVLILLREDDLLELLTGTRPEKRKYKKTESRPGHNECFEEETETYLNTKEVNK